MYRIGEFSKLGKTTITTLRFYEKQGLLKPARIDEYTGYRYYQGGQLIDLARIGLGIACVPDYMLRNTDRLVRVALKEPLPKRQLVVVRNDTLQVSPAAERFLDMFNIHCK